MNYIRKVVIENFQSHEYTELEYDPALNVIVGPSDQGKSAIIRAIKWVLFNEPRGAEFIRHGAKLARVTLMMGNGYNIVRERSASKNRYTVTDPEGNSSVYEGFGNEVPEEARKAHGISKVTIDTDSSVSLNLGEQLEGPFLISETGSVRARAIGRLTGVHIIDKAIRGCLIDLKRENQIADDGKKELDIIEENLKTYDDLEKLEKMIGESEKTAKLIEALINKVSLLEKQRNSLRQIEYEINETEKAAKKTVNLDKTEAIINKLYDKTRILAELDSHRAKLSIVNYELKTQKEILEKTVNVPHMKDRAAVLDEKAGMLVQLEKMGKSLKSIDTSIIEGNKYLIKVSQEIEQAIKDYEKELRRASKCPVCFCEIDDITIDRVIKQYKEE